MLGAKGALRIALTGGGTAGHVFPHFAVMEDPRSPLAAALSEGRLEVYYVGSFTGMERELVERHAPSWRYIAISAGKLRRYASLSNLSDPARVVIGYAQALRALSRVRPGVLFSKGGFVSAPVVWAAWTLRIPVVIHESDATPALATRLTLPFCARALTAFPGTEKHLPARLRERVTQVGLPLRPGLFAQSKERALRHFGLPGDRKVLLIFGGSLGAQALNERVRPVLPQLAGRFAVIHIVGKGKGFPVAAGPAYRQFEFLGEDMAMAYAAADLALCRAGASSIFELLAARVPMILVPLGLDQSRGDQIVNARIFAEHGWARQIAEEQLVPEVLLELVDQEMEQLDVRRQALDGAPAADAAARVGSVLMEILERQAGAGLAAARGITPA